MNFWNFARENELPVLDAGDSALVETDKFGFALLLLLLLLLMLMLMLLLLLVGLGDESEKEKEGKEGDVGGDDVGGRLVERG